MCTFKTPPVISVNFQTDKYNVSESEGTVMIHLVANGTSEFNYNVILTLMEYSTGQCVGICIYYIVYENK